MENKKDSVIIFPGAQVFGDVELGENVSVWHGAVIRGDTDSFTIGDNSKIGAGSVVLSEVPPNSTVVGVQQSHYSEAVDYRKDIAPCRTFVFLHEIEILLKLGLIKGGSVESAMVVVEKPISESTKKRICKTFGREDIEVERGYLSHAPLRFENEIARHKLLDILGDLALLGRRIRGHVEALRPGHYANTQLAQQLE